MHFGLLIICLLTACAQPPTPALTQLPPRILPSQTLAPTLSPFPSPTRAPTWTPEATQTPYQQAYSEYFIESLRAREYGGGQLDVIEKVEENDVYTRYIISYPSDGLTIYGFADVPRGSGPFPLIIILHGYSDPGTYSIFAQDAGYSDMYAKQGYMVVSPTMRNYAPSDAGDNLFMVGMSIDVLNLIALVRSGDGLFKRADAGRLGLWAYSMGGAIALRVLTISPFVKAAFLLAPMSGDDYLNAGYLAGVGDKDAIKGLSLPPATFSGTSPQYFYQNITAAIDIHHGLADTTIPPAWSEKTCEQLKILGKTVNCYFYEDMRHAFDRAGRLKLNLRMVNFFKTHFGP